MRLKLEVVNTTDDPQEVISLVKSVFGASAAVEIAPTSNSAEDCAIFAIEQLITQDQLMALFREKARYEVDIVHIRKRVLSYLEKQLDHVIVSNEEKYS